SSSGSDLHMNAHQSRSARFESTAMKYMLMMHAPKVGWEIAGIGTWPPADIKAHIQFMMNFSKELADAGELVGAEGLAMPDQATIVRAGKDGLPVTEDRKSTRLNSS